MSNGFFCLPRSLTRDPLWKSLPLTYQHIFLVILDHCVYKPTKFDDHGKIIELKPGQLCISERELVKLCHPSINRMDVQRSLVKFQVYDFLRQEVSHRKNVLTITHPDICILFKEKIEPKSEPNLSQTCAIKKQVNKIINKNIFLSDSIEIGLVSFFFQQIKSINPNAKVPNEQAWARDFDLLLRIDKRSEEEIKSLILWATKDPFWHKNILSPKTLRKQWDRLVLEKNPKILPIKSQFNEYFEENKSIAINAINNLVSKTCELKIEDKQVHFIPLEGQQMPYAFNLSDKNFSKKFKDELSRKQFKHIKEI